MATKLDRAHSNLAAALLERHASDALPVVEAAPADELAEFLEEQPVGRAAAIFARLTPETAAQALAALTDETGRELLTRMPPHRAAALVARLPPDAKERTLSRLPDESAAELRELMEYPAGTAGRWMDPRVITFRPDTLAQDAVRRLRRVRRRRVQNVFVVDESTRLLGSIPLQEVVLAPSEERLSGLLHGDPVSVQATSPREAVIEVLRQHGSDSLPVVDFDGRLVGVLRQEELIATARQDAAADAVTMTGASQDERALSSPLFAVRKRLPWLQINLLTAFLAASVVGLFEETIARFTALAVLLPVVAGQSGNTGAQSLAVTMRGLALREIQVRHWLRVTLKEGAAGAVNGAAVGVTTAIAVYVWSRSLGLAFVIGVSMIISMTAAGFAGALIPVVLASLRQDPAQSSSII
ncbi:magnesium transporter, partial [bacterium]|nr:magnesium transporter [bacterium]